MSDNRTTELLPCPFCGGEAHVVDHHNDDGSVSVGCANDTCLGFSGLGWLYGTEAEAIEAWNTRAERTCYPSENLYGFLMCCSECGRSLKDVGGTLFRYCPSCGAKVVES